jgi:ankyrin repeat protein
MRNTLCILIILLLLPACGDRQKSTSSTEGVNKSFSKAAMAGDIEEVERLLADGADVNAGKLSDLPLYVAAKYAHKDIVELLLAEGADVNASNGHTTLLHVAVDQGAPHAVDMLISNGADVNLRDDMGRTPLHLAAAYGLGYEARKLMEARCDINAIDKDGKTPFDMTRREGIKELLRDYGAVSGNELEQDKDK